ncbi:methylated-DNA--[protein]-cysteine S-methyltransferase [Aestuariirhabdus sp. Z084]|uniref:bifunctional transcriptional activator/DNA repair enzyme AdaA n=1 Tax=Aestuariirhabdus haliotis TaxID=2918751 RepID=UPI00201B3A65|nr:methylated-DNA--[protein]-cysteine S-methyltransferase [Aestuariirhabdus haliotis]MCL6415075.1 methylated-DNA--[protein]-cysteine S-methyltransferase [Aestuariirhabdus haliotis]MCL6419007.1 methylated-DNA--[protein]-cysteine S-methyltransferase [Aestuariirhabdus haliotis]
MLIQDESQVERFYQALLNREPAYVGTFYVGVKTTSIFCIATCRARKPKKENVEFYTTLKEALDAGFRPCKVCRPTENSHQAPPQVDQALRLVIDNPKSKVSDERLKAEGISPSLVRRWFNKHYGMTFQAYQRMYRINSALEELKAGKSSLQTAYEMGYESLSGFGYTYKKVMGASPRHNPQQSVILLSRLTTPLGPMFVCATERGICLLEFVDRRMLETEFRDIQRLFRATIVSGENDHIRQARKELEEYFSGQRHTFEVQLDAPGTDFQQRVWQALHSIPYGTTASYQQQAEALQRPNAVRAVASANGHNRISIMIPCHRVIGKNGKLTGYGGGLERKRWLLDHERQWAC